MNKFFMWLRTSLLRLLALFSGRKLDEEFEQEINSHLSLLEQENLRRGMSEKEARYAALRSFGRVTQVRESNRQKRGVFHLETFFQDVRYALRMLRKNPGFSIGAVATLALGIALNTTIFSTVSGLLLQPPPVLHPDGVMMVVATNRAHGWDQYPVSAPDFKDWQQQNHSFADVAAAAAYQSATLTGEGAPKQVTSMLVTANFFSVLGVPPIQGRTFVAGEDAPGQDHEVVLSHELWQQQFAGDPQIVDKDVTISGERYAVIGVMPESFRMLIFPAQIWMPVTFTKEQLQPEGRGSRFLQVFARLKADSSLKSAQADLAALAATFAQSYPETNKGWGASVETLQEFMIRDLRIRPILIVMMSAVGLILLIVCANLSGLLLSKLAARGREMAVRAAIGASRWRLIRQLLVESLVISLLGGATGLIFSLGGIRITLLMLTAQGRVGQALADQISMDSRVLVFIFVLALLTALVFGLAPAISGTKVDVQTTLKGGNWTGRGGARHRLRSVLVATQVALALAFVMGAGFLISAIVESLRTGLGFDPAAIITADVSLSGAKYTENNNAKAAFFREVIQNIQALPGVAAAGAANNVAGTGARRMPFRIKGNADVATGELPLARYYVITDQYLKTMGIPVLQGRDFSQSDNEKSPAVILVNKALAQRFFGNENPVGKFIRVESGGAEQSGWREIVGIVADVKSWPSQPVIDPQIYECYWQHPGEFMTLAARTGSDPGSMAKSIQEAIWSVDKDQPVGRLATLTAMLSEENAGDEFATEMFSFFSGLALLLATIGVYGIAAYSVAQRTREIGIRMALGAQRSHVVKMILGGSARLVAIGSIVGLLLAWPLPRVFTAAFEGLQFRTGWIYVLVPVMMASIAMLACSLPARRATRIDPLVALRYE